MATEQASSPKKKAKPRERNFVVEDSSLFQRSRVIRQHYINNLAAFTAFDPDLDNALATAWLNSIDECEGIENDETADDGLQIHSTAVDEACEACFDKAKELQHYVEKAFPKKDAILKAFGFTERKKARARTSNTLLWMKMMRKLAVERFAAELAAVNMPPALITELETVQSNLQDKEVAQEFYKRIMIIETQSRIEKYNHLHSFIVTVHKAAQVVFIKDNERRGLFNLT